MTVSSLYGGLRPLLRGGSSCFGPSGRAKSVGHATENRNFTRGIVVDPSPNLIPGPGTTTPNTRFSWPPSRPCGKLPRPSPIPRLGIWLQPSPAVRMTCHSHRTEKTAVVPSIRKHQRGRRSLASVGVGSSPHRPSPDTTKPRPRRSRTPNRTKLGPALVHRTHPVKKRQ